MPMNYIYIILGVCALFWLVVIIIAVSKKGKKEKKVKVGTKEDEVRYDALAKPFNQDNSPNVSFVENDMILQQNVTYVVGEVGNNKIKQGGYVVLSTSDNIQEFNLRLGEFVRPYKHGTKIILKDGETITPVSCSVILR